MIVVALLTAAALVTRRSGILHFRASRDRAGNSSPTAQTGEEGQRLPDFCLRDLDGHQVCSSDFRQKILLIDFWASWCEPCKREMSGYQRLQDQYRDRGLAVIGVGLTMDNAAAMKTFASQLDVRYTLLIGSDQVQQNLGILGIPTTLLVDRNGIVRKRVVGFEYTAEFEKAVRGLLLSQS